ncbi:hypothetical protein [Thiohalomonas denitrificans]|nr:hypothetical protein [Thiohalomonas denitrificans]
MLLHGTRNVIAVESLYQDPELSYPGYRLLESGADVLVPENGEER